eukprot:401173_1
MDCHPLNAIELSKKLLKLFVFQSNGNAIKFRPSLAQENQAQNQIPTVTQENLVIFSVFFGGRGSIVDQSGNTTMMWCLFIWMVITAIPMTESGESKIIATSKKKNASRRSEFVSWANIDQYKRRKQRRRS